MKNKNTLSQYVLSVEDVDFDRQLKSRRFVRTGACAGLAIMLLYVVACILPPVGNDNTNAATKPAVASDTVLSINIDDPAISLELTPTSASGTFATTSTPINVGVATNNITGYTVGIKASSSSDTATKLINSITECEDTPTSAKCSINTLDDAVSAADYAAVAATELNNTWGYLPSKYNSVVNEEYLPAPSSGGDIIEATSAPNAPQPGYSGDTTDVSQLAYNEYTIDLGARLDYTPYAGSYTNTFVITAVGNPVPYSVTYEENKPIGLSDAMEVENVPGPQADSVNSGSTMALLLSTNVPMISDTTGGVSSYAPYVFAGWCTVQPEVPNIFNGESNTGNYQVCPDGATLYQPGDNYGIDQTQAINTDILYATWQAPATVTFDGNGLIFNGIASEDTNTIQYIPYYEGGTITDARKNYSYAGAYAEPAPVDVTKHFIFRGWSTSSSATEATYVNQEAIENDLNLEANKSLTLYAIWSYATKITFSKNGADGTEIMEPQYIAADTTEALNANVYTNTGLVFGEWNTNNDGSGDSYDNQGNYHAAADSDEVTLFARWGTTNFTITAGEHIDTLIVSNGRDRYKPSYVTPESPTRSITIPTPAKNTKLIITVVPEPRYVISSDATNSSYVEEYGMGNLASKTLLTTTYVVGNVGDNITISASLPGSDSAHIAYATMQNTTGGQCPAYNDSAMGMNVTDARDNKSYAVARFGNGCYMLSNLRLDGGAELTPTDSNVSSAYTLPVDVGSSGWTVDACQPRMATADGDYFYNWPAATARTNTTSSASTCSNDTSNSVGDICPAGWTLPTYNEITAGTLWGSGANPGMLYTAGYISVDGIDNVGAGGYWWSSVRGDNDQMAVLLNSDGTNAYRSSGSKAAGHAVRCFRSN